ncbi:MAG: type II toxin-antitoxin system prevent-host-death family antitoxin [Patescibacteria group bacterium]
MAKNTNIIGLKELRENTEDYIKQVKRGRSFLVVRRSKPVFRVEPVDEWGDEGQWETVVDFTKIKKGGVPAEIVLKHLRKLNEQD